MLVELANNIAKNMYNAKKHQDTFIEGFGDGLGCILEKVTWTVLHLLQELHSLRTVAVTSWCLALHLHYRPSHGWAHDQIMMAHRLYVQIGGWFTETHRHRHIEARACGIAFGYDSHISTSTPGVWGITCTAHRVTCSNKVWGNGNWGTLFEHRHPTALKNFGGSGRGGRVGTRPWCWFVCLWQHLLASRPCTF